MATSSILLSDLGLFFGRFHPLVVHLPIGILLLSIVMEWLGRRERFAGLRRAVPTTLLLGAVSAIAAAVLGFLLAAGGGYDGVYLDWHRWLGIGLVVAASLAWAARAGYLRLPRRGYAVLLGFVGVLIFGAGHFGGVLTHGEGYLSEYAPFWGGARTGVVKVDSTLWAQPDSVRVYDHIVRPVIAQKCMACHNENKQNGGLAMHNSEALLKGGDHGPVIVPGDAWSSELARRTRLPQNERRFMPPKGLPMSVDEVRLLEWWIESGADFSARLGETEIPETVAAILERDFGWRRQKPPFVETVSVKPLAPEPCKQIEAAGFQLQVLAENNNLLEVSPRGDIAPLSKATCEALLAGKDQITWLNLGEAGIDDNLLVFIGQLPLLSRLRLERNPISSAGVEHLRALQHLESLNLYATAIDDQALEILAELPALRRLYLWQTQVSEAGVEKLRRKRPELDIDTGFQFAKGE
jgi:uncharacterized membrane protein